MRKCAKTIFLLTAIGAPQPSEQGGKMETSNQFVVYEEDWPLRSFKTMEAARQWAEKNCRPQEYEIRSGGKAIKDALSLEEVMNKEALW